MSADSHEHAVLIALDRLTRELQTSAALAALTIRRPKIRAGEDAEGKPWVEIEVGIWTAGAAPEFVDSVDAFVVERGSPTEDVDGTVEWFRKELVEAIGR